METNKLWETTKDKKVTMLEVTKVEGNLVVDSPKSKKKVSESDVELDNKQFERVNS